MALAFPKQKRQFPWTLIGSLLLVFGVIGTAGWHGYKWYAYGEALPIDIPVLAASSEPKPDDSEIGAMQVLSHTVAAGEPRFLKISGLGIEKARIFSADLDSTGFVKSPINKHDVSWFNKSTLPGAGGVSLLSGHGDTDAEDSIFSKLASVAPGSIIDVELGNGDIVKYQVKDILNLSLEEMQDSGVDKLTEAAEAGKNGLNLTTRDGVWVPRYEQYSSRIIVRSVMVE